ncbi:MULTISPECIES: GNAT family N-acetyltransferase [Shouchella]|uniref:GNAT family N-acetyltransferase n=2 Tax=Shouchella TaxID=2893057 RepID=A0ABY7W6V7_9BACI|nr:MULTISPECIES: GNAT family N-acetyltransferase [Shouchella]MED4126641.1 GNAT family N-acetyltransferase [Shouchella miscanthi]WDF04658.1 GNAT family N-acetyltransferase [Shouchella hunanensis]GAF21843.1 acetyltransferase [Bacillus sp. JCM 19047]
MIRKAVKQDLVKIEEMAIRATKKMNAEGSDQWDKHYPTIQHFTKDLDLGSLFVYEQDGVVVGSITIDQSFAPEYTSTSLQWSEQQRHAGTFHRLLVDPSARKAGIAAALIDFAEKHSHKKGLTAMQVDTYSLNEKAQQLFEKYGYEKVGTLQFPGKEAIFFGFEKQLT